MIEKAVLPLNCRGPKSKIKCQNTILGTFGHRSRTLMVAFDLKSTTSCLRSVVSGLNETVVGL